MQIDTSKINNKISCPFVARCSKSVSLPNLSIYNCLLWCLLVVGCVCVFWCGVGKWHTAHLGGQGAAGRARYADTLPTLTDVVRKRGHPHQQPPCKRNANPHQRKPSSTTSLAESTLGLLVLLVPGGTQYYLYTYLAAIKENQMQNNLFSRTERTHKEKWKYLSEDGSYPSSDDGRVYGNKCSYIKNNGVYYTTYLLI